MSTDTLDTKKLFPSLETVSSELLNLISSTESTTLNSIPFKDSWTAAQLASHVTKSNKAIIQALNMEGKAAARKPDERARELKDMFLNFATKFKSPDFIVPDQGRYQKELVITDLKKSIEELRQTGNKVDLVEIISLPAFGEITKLELLHFVLYHTQRHIHQLKKILKSLTLK